MRFELSHDRKSITDEDILADMRRVAEIVGTQILRQQDYNAHGKFCHKTAVNRFGAWSNAVEKAGLQKSVSRDLSQVQLFQNLLRIWTCRGRQPLYSEVQKPLSDFHVTTYERRFGSWRLALEAFVEWANAEDFESPESETNTTPTSRKTPRQADLRLRFRVLRRDNFKCCLCGTSPALQPGIVLEVDHKIPSSKGGETVLDNLQTLCQVCNIGKSNLPLTEAELG
jgi:hypothetical protein